MKFHAGLLKIKVSISVMNFTTCEYNSRYERQQYVNLLMKWALCAACCCNSQVFLGGGFDSYCNSSWDFTSLFSLAWNNKGIPPNSSVKETEAWVKGQGKRRNNIRQVKALLGQLLSSGFTYMLCRS